MNSSVHCCRVCGRNAPYFEGKLTSLDAFEISLKAGIDIFADVVSNEGKVEMVGVLESRN